MVERSATSGTLACRDPTRGTHLGDPATLNTQGMQFGLEERLKQTLVRHWLVVASALLFGLAIGIRLALLQFESVDYTDHLKPWFETLASTPGLDAFRNPTWNYTPA